MNEKEKYLDMMNKFKEKYPSYTEIKINEIERKIFNEGEFILCVNNNFIIKDSTHGLKEGLTFGKIYEIVSIPEIDMINIKNDLDEIVPYYTWRFLKIKN